jgi:hypothetical protein
MVERMSISRFSENNFLIFVHVPLIYPVYNTTDVLHGLSVLVVFFSFNFPQLIL